MDTLSHCTPSTYYRKIIMEPEKENENQYPVYPEDDGTDRPRNPYSPV